MTVMTDRNATTLKRRLGEQVEEQSVQREDLVNGHTKHNGKTGISQSPTVATATVAFTPALMIALAFIFGGCCSNVYTLESILALSPATATLVTFLQFLLTSLYTVRSQLTIDSSPSSTAGGTSIIPRLRQRIVPISKWIIYTSFFLAVNMLNNLAFNYRISIPLHIILRSAGPVTSMIVGYTVGKRRYTTRQVTAVILLFGGVVLAALSDAQSKSHGNVSSPAELKKEGTPEPMMQALLTKISTSKFVDQAPGFALLFSALILSALMGLYTDRLYETYGRSPEITHENIFYSHTLSLPFFAVQYQSLQKEFSTLVARSSTFQPSTITSAALSSILPPIQTLTAITMPDTFKPAFETPVLTTVCLLLANAFTQIVCITGVHQLSTLTTSLTVTIVLNVRKLVSLILSIWLFGNTLPTGVAVGATLVFLGGLLYGWKGKQPAAAAADTSQEKKKV